MNDDRELMRARSLTPAQVCQRAGVTVATLHHYEREGLIEATRTSGNQRRYHRDVLRRIALIRVGQSVGISLAEMRTAFKTLPTGTPEVADWERLARQWRTGLDARIASLQDLRDRLDGCIGCGCLSLAKCSLYNPSDVLAGRGTGAVRWDPHVRAEGDLPG